MHENAAKPVDSPKLFPPMVQNHNFAKFLTTKVLYYTVYSDCSIRKYQSLKINCYFVDFNF